MAAMRQAMTAVLVLLVLLGPAGLVPHHHADEQGDGHCIACLLAAACVAVLPALVALLVAPASGPRQIAPGCPVLCSLRCRTSLPRAPPVQQVVSA